MAASSAVGRRERLVKLKSGRHLGVAEFGAPSGLPVIACHGAPASRLMFEVADAGALALGIRLIAFDRPGYGLSPLDYGATLASRTEIFAELPDALGIDRFALFGISGGAPYAVALAARLGSRVTALGLVSPLGPIADVCRSDESDRVDLSFAHRSFFLDLPNHPWVLRANAEAAMRGFRLAPRAFASLFAHLLPEADSAIVSNADVADNIVAMTMEATRNGISGGVADLQIYGEPWNVDFGAIEARAKLWQGTADSIVPIEVALRLGALIPGCEVEQVPDAGHFWVYEHVPEILAAVAALASGDGAQ
ncbi:MAG: alpha/beta fold hydrolase [Hyphomicrobiaceae bacterium]|nr:alpha/beta fold hydrolase [Hyphomicrobiaceae bacterium]